MPEPQPRLQIRLLGDPQVALDGRRIDLEMGRRARELLFYLALEPGRRQLREKLMTLLWPDKPADRASANLRRALFLLRGALGAAADDVLDVTDTALGLRAGAAWVDRQALERYLVAGADGEVSALRRALELYTGELLDTEYADWVLVEREVLHRRVLEAAGRLVASLEQAGDAAGALSVCRRVLAHDPLDEGTHARAVGLLAGLGDRSAAVAQYELCRDLLARELEVTPGPELEAAYRRALEGPVVPRPSAPAAPIPVPTVAPALPPAAARRPRLRRWLAAGAAGAMALAVLVAVWVAVDHRLAAAERTAAELVNEHIVASYMENLPVESDDPARLDGWFRDQVPYRVSSSPGAGAGLRLFGGGLCDLAGEIAATAVYRGAEGERVSVFKFPEGDLPLPMAPAVAGDEGMRALVYGDHSIVFWTDAGLVYAVVSDIRLESLTGLARGLAGS
jgi:DNA-binding SARP family transcriptional activator